MGHAINERVIRWSELRLPHPTPSEGLARWTIDGPFAVRKYYRVEGTDQTVQIDHLDRRNDDGTLSGCLYCGGTALERSADVNWPPIVLLAVVGLALAYFTYGVSLLIVAYPIWFLWAAADRVETCPSCKSEFVNFREGPRP